MAETDYEVGYGKPPEGGQFQKGRSGNPSGRPKGKKSETNSLVEATLKHLGEEIFVNVDGRRQKMTMRDAVARKLVVKAAQGDPKSIDLVMRVENARVATGTTKDVDLGLSDDTAEEIIRNHERDDQTGALDEEENADV